MRRKLTLAIAALTWLCTAAQAQRLFDDGDFVAWTFGQHVAGLGPPVGAAMASLQATGGNPGPHLHVYTSNFGLAGFLATLLKTDLATMQPLAGVAFTLTMDVAVDSAQVPGQSVQLLVEQQGALYVVHGSIQTGVPASFAPVALSGVFDASRFSRIGSAGPAIPVLTGGVPTRFGFTAGAPGDNRMRYDNVRLDLVPALGAGVVAVHATDAWALVALAFLVALTARKALDRGG